MSQRDSALQAIREVILSGRLGVGARTSERRLTEVFLSDTGLGRTPVREALAILTEQGIVDQFPQSGFAVRRVDADEARKVLVLQQITERLVVTEAARTRIRTDHLEEIVRQLEAAAGDANSSSRLLDLSRTLHTSLTRLAGYESAVDAIGGFRDRLALFIAGTHALRARELADVAVACRELVAAIASDPSGVMSSERLDRLITTDANLIAARELTRTSSSVEVAVPIPR